MSESVGDSAKSEGVERGKPEKSRAACQPLQLGSARTNSTKLGIVVKRGVIAVFGTLVVLLLVLATFAWYSDWSVRADHDEQVRDLSGDDLIRNPTDRSLTQSRFGALFLTFGRGSPRWDQVAPDGTPTTS